MNFVSGRNLHFQLRFVPVGIKCIYKVSSFSVLILKTELLTKLYESIKNLLIAVREKKF